MFQVCELRKRQLVEANVRLYAVKYEPLPLEMGAYAGSRAAGPMCCQTYAMRLAHPNDDLGSKLLLSTPQVVVHEVDDHSPMSVPPFRSISLLSSLPPPEWSPGRYRSDGGLVLSHDSGKKRQLSLFGLEVGTNKTPFSANPLHEEESPEFPSTELSRHSIASPSPSEPDETPVDGARAISTTRRCDYSFPNIIQRNASSKPPSSFTPRRSHHSPSSLAEDGMESEPSEAAAAAEATAILSEERKEVELYMKETRMEIVVILEGVDPLTSHTVQAFHSYALEDIEWDHFFAPCTFLDPDGWTLVDFMKFHNLIPVPSDVGQSYRVCSPSHC
jgi:hypothetical protein